MYCKNCSTQLPDDAAFCTSCGTPTNAQTNASKKFCSACGAEISKDAVVCTSCGANVGKPIPPANAKSKMAAGLLAIFLGGFGVHSFYLGFTGKGIAQIAVTLITCGAGYIWGFIEGILILCGNIKADAQGNPLQD